MFGTLALGLGLGSPHGGGGGGPTSLDFIWYGQSNQLGHFTEGSSPPAAADDTEVWDNDGGEWGAVPAANGIREFLNAVNAATGLPCRALSGGVSGVAIADLQKGDGSGYYEAMMADVVASGMTPAYIIIHHGEGNANAASPNASTYIAALDDIHGDITADLGLTRAQCPMIVSSLGALTVDGGWPHPDSSWATIQNALAAVNSTYPNIYFSHSNLDSARVDSVHWTAASYGRSGKRYAQTVNVLEGVASGLPRWFATASAIVDATTTDITVAHSMGTDFTPTTGITGFEISGNNGADWEAPSAAVRQGATTIRLTHSSLGTANNRLVRYGFGKEPDMSDPALDNGSLAAPLVYTTDDLVAEGSGALPAPTYRTTVAASDAGSNLWQTATGNAIGTADAGRLVLVGVTGSDGTSRTISGLTIVPDTGDPVAATKHIEQATSTNNYGSIWGAIVPTGTTCRVQAQFTGTIFFVPVVAIWTIDSGTMNSTTPVATGKAQSNSATSATFDIETADGGFVIAFSDHTDVSSNTGSITGDETYAERTEQTFSGGIVVVADAAGTAADAASTITATWTGDANKIVLMAASFR